jgi:hypothetical protein
MPRGPAVIEPLEGRTFLTVAGGGFTETAVAAGLRQPTAIAIGPNRDPPIYVSEKDGRIKYFRDGDPAPAVTAVTLPVASDGERGHPRDDRSAGSSTTTARSTSPTRPASRSRSSG